MSPDLRIREYEPGDQEQVRRLHERTIREAGTPPEKLPDTSDMTDVEGSYLDAGGTFLVGEYEDEIVAIGGLVSAGESVGELKRMRVAPEHQGRGFGRQLLHALEEAARERGFDRLVLDTAERQDSAGFYRAQGYREVDRYRWREFDLVAFEKEL